MNIVIRRNPVTGQWTGALFTQNGFEVVQSFSRAAVIELAEIYWSR